MRRALIAGFASLLVVALIATAAQGAGEPVSTASRAQCTAGKGVCTKVAGHRRKHLALVFRTRRVKKRNYGLCVRTARHPGAPGSQSSQSRAAPGGAFTLCRSFQLGRRERDASFARVPAGFRSRVAYKRIYPYTGPGRYVACWTWGDSCGRNSSVRRLELTKIVFWVKRDSRVIVRRP